MLSKFNFESKCIMYMYMMNIAVVIPKLRGEKLAHVHSQKMAIVRYLTFHVQLGY